MPGAGAAGSFCLRRGYLQADLVVARTDVDAASVPNFKRVNYETKPRTVVFATKLAITDCSTASRGAALPDTIGSNGVPRQSKADVAGA